MSFVPSRLRGGEWLAAAGAIILLVALLALHWYGAGAATGARTGWSGLAHLRWLLALAILVALALVIAQGACRAPALPACLSVISSVIGFVALVALIVRVVLDAQPRQQAGAWIGLLGGLALFAGSYVSLRQEGIRPQDGPGEIPVITLPPAPSP